MSKTSKLEKYYALAKSASLAGAMPTTRGMGKAAFLRLLKRYKGVVVKPAFGSGGAGVIIVTRSGGHRCRVQYGARQRRFADASSAYRFIRAKSGRRQHIVQRKIALARIRGRPFDARVMVQRSRSAKWVATGLLAKVAGRGFMITNVARSKGYVLPLSTAIRRSDIRGASAGPIQRRVIRTARRAAVQLRRYYPIRIVGVDMGLDARGKEWIIEVNFAPSKSLFLQLNNKSMYRRIVAMAAAGGKR